MQFFNLFFYLFLYILIIYGNPCRDALELGGNFNGPNCTIIDTNATINSNNAFINSSFIEISVSKLIISTIFITDFNNCSITSNELIITDSTIIGESIDIVSDNITINTTNFDIPNNLLNINTSIMEFNNFTISNSLNITFNCNNAIFNNVYINSSTFRFNSSNIDIYNDFTVEALDRILIAGNLLTVNQSISDNFKFKCSFAVLDITLITNQLFKLELTGTDTVEFICLQTSTFNNGATFDSPGGLESIIRFNEEFSIGNFTQSNCDEVHFNCSRIFSTISTNLLLQSSVYFHSLNTEIFGFKFFSMFSLEQGNSTYLNLHDMEGILIPNDVSINSTVVATNIDTITLIGNWTLSDLSLDIRNLTLGTTLEDHIEITCSNSFYFSGNINYSDNDLTINSPLAQFINVGDFPPSSDIILTLGEGEYIFDATTISNTNVLCTTNTILEIIGFNEFLSINLNMNSFKVSLFNETNYSKLFVSNYNIDESVLLANFTNYTGEPDFSYVIITSMLQQTQLVSKINNQFNNIQILGNVSNVTIDYQESQVVLRTNSTSLVANDDCYFVPNTTSSGTVTQSILDNDISPSGSLITVTQQIFSSPNGTISLNSDGTFTYCFNINFSFSVCSFDGFVENPILVFTYMPSTSSEVGNEATVTISVNTDTTNVIRCEDFIPPISPIISPVISPIFSTVSPIVSSASSTSSETFTLSPTQTISATTSSTFIPSKTGTQTISRTVSRTHSATKSVSKSNLIDISQSTSTINTFSVSNSGNNNNTVITPTPSSTSTISLSSSSIYYLVDPIIVTQSPSSSIINKASAINEISSELSITPSISPTETSIINYIEITNDDGLVISEIFTENEGELAAEISNFNEYFATLDIIESTVIVIELFDEYGISQNQFTEPIEICIEYTGKKDKDDLCLGYLDESSNPPKWRCEDNCLKKSNSNSNNNLLCGDTNHLTNFALLLKGKNSFCGSITQDYVTGSSLGDILLLLSFLGVACYCIIYIICLSFIIKPITTKSSRKMKISIQESKNNISSVY